MDYRAPLAQIGNINNPVDDERDRVELIDSLRELRDTRIPHLDEALQILEQERPQINASSSPPPLSLQHKRWLLGP
jgi:hypothetical protein